MSRRKQRGAAMTEALIVLPVLVILDAAAIHMFDVYESKLVTMRDSRSAAWSTAIGSCEGGNKEVEGAAPDTSLAEAPLTAAKSLARGPTLTRPLEATVDRVTGSAARGSAGNSIFAGGALSSRAPVLCNERPDDISPIDVKETVDSVSRKLLGQ